MAAIDKFDWYVASMVKNASPDKQRFIHDQREYLLTLRSEDERQRFIDNVIEDLMSKKGEA
jgi:hypothetical protein